jgi:predicted nucleotidyltransferase
MGYSTVLLDEAIEKKKKAGEDLRLQLLEKVDHVLYSLSREIPFEEAFLFGSITKPFSFSESSDIDVAFVGLQDEHFFRAMSFLSAELGFDVDIVQLESHRWGGKIKREGTRWKKKE